MPETFIVFQSPRSGKFVSDMSNFIQETLENIGEMFQSPRSGKFVSDLIRSIVNSWQIMKSFNPLDRGNLYQIHTLCGYIRKDQTLFQSPRSGKFVSDSLM